MSTPEPALLDAERVDELFMEWIDDLVRHHGDRTVAAVLSSPAIQAAFTGDISQHAVVTPCSICGSVRHETKEPPL